MYSTDIENWPTSSKDLLKSQVNITYETKVLALYLFTEGKHNIIFPASHTNNPRKLHKLEFSAFDFCE